MANENMISTDALLCNLILSIPLNKIDKHSKITIYEKYIEVEYTKYFWVSMQMYLIHDIIPIKYPIILNKYQFSKLQKIIRLLLKDHIDFKFEYLENEIEIIINQGKFQLKKI